MQSSKKPLMEVKLVSHKGGVAKVRVTASADAVQEVFDAVLAGAVQHARASEAATADEQTAESRDLSPEQVLDLHSDSIRASMQLSLAEWAARVATETLDIAWIDTPIAEVPELVPERPVVFELKLFSVPKLTAAALSGLHVSRQAVEINDSDVGLFIKSMAANQQLAADITDDALAKHCDLQDGDQLRTIVRENIRDGALRADEVRILGEAVAFILAHVRFPVCDTLVRRRFARIAHDCVSRQTKASDSSVQEVAQQTEMAYEAEKVQVAAEVEGAMVVAALRYYWNLRVDDAELNEQHEQRQMMRKFDVGKVWAGAHKSVYFKKLRDRIMQTKIVDRLIAREREIIE